MTGHNESLFSEIVSDIPEHPVYKASQDRNLTDAIGEYIVGSVLSMFAETDEERDEVKRMLDELAPVREGIAQEYGLSEEEVTEALRMCNDRLTGEALAGQPHVQA